MATSKYQKPHHNSSSSKTPGVPAGPYDYLLDNGLIHVVNTVDHCDRIVERLKRESAKYKALGFDCEWVQYGKKRNKVALIQLSSFDGLCAVFQLSQMKTFPKSLKDLLEDEEIYKVGVATDNDARHLKQDYSVDTNPFLDVRHITKHFGGFNIPYVPGLASLSEYILNKKMDKDKRVSSSNWDKKKLDQKQIEYAAIDAHVGIRVFAELVDRCREKKIYDIVKSYVNTSHDDQMRCFTIDGLPETEDENLNDIFRKILKILSVDTSQLFYLWCNRLGALKNDKTRTVSANYVGAKIGADIMDKYELFNENNPNDELNTIHLGFPKANPIIISKNIPYLDITLQISGIPYRKNENLTDIFVRILETISFRNERVRVSKCVRSKSMIIIKLCNLDHIDEIVAQFLNFNRNNPNKLSTTHLGVDGPPKFVTLVKSQNKRKKKKEDVNSRNIAQRNDSVQSSASHSNGQHTTNNNDNNQGDRSGTNNNRYSRKQRYRHQPNKTDY